MCAVVRVQGGQIRVHGTAAKAVRVKTTRHQLVVNNGAFIKQWQLRQASHAILPVGQAVERPDTPTRVLQDVANVVGGCTLGSDPRDRKQWLCRFEWGV
eukprot:1336499-Prymnesium_polylepis.3